MDRAKKVNNFILREFHFQWISSFEDIIFPWLNLSEIPWLFLGLEVIRLSQAFPDMWQPYLQ